MDLMASMTLHGLGDDGEPKTVADPCCGSGRMLLAVAEKRPGWEFYGQDVDLRCVRIATINMALWNHYAWIVWGDSLRLESKLAYRTGFNFRGGVVREVPTEQCPYPILRASESETPAGTPQVVERKPPPDGEPDRGAPRRGSQGHLF